MSEKESKIKKLLRRKLFMGATVAAGLVFFIGGIIFWGGFNTAMEATNTLEFCVSCHESGLRMPLAHSTSNWIARHGRAAKNDVENCASCHQSSDPTCGLSGCHNDFDGIRGTNPKIHKSNNTLFDGDGYWHEDNGSYCYQCHISTQQAGVGFCGYCHGSEAD